MKSIEELDLGERIAFQAVDADWFDHHRRNIRVPTFDKCRQMRVFALRVSLAQLAKCKPAGKERAAQHGKNVNLLQAVASGNNQGNNNGAWLEFRLGSPRKGIGEIAAVLVRERFDDEDWSMRLISVGLVREKSASTLTSFFRMKAKWRTSKASVVMQGLPSGPLDHEHIVAYDVGQGSAAGIHDAAGWVRCYIDIGGGIWPNKPTYPDGLRLCFTHWPLVILTHWDEDHYVSATFDADAFSCDWLVPDQVLGPIDFALLLAVDHWGGRVFVWPHAAGAVVTYGPLKIGRCTGDELNDSGLAVLVETTSGSVLFPGDCGYEELPAFWPTGPRLVLGLAVPHHGGKTKTTPSSLSFIPKPSDLRESRVVYSVGLGDGHKVRCFGHPRGDVVDAHIAAGWTTALTRYTRAKRKGFGVNSDLGHTLLTPHPFPNPCRDKSCAKPCGMQVLR